MTFRLITKAIFSALLLAFCLTSCAPKEPKATATTTAFAAKGLIQVKDSISLFYQFQGTGKDTLVVVHGGPGMDSEYMVADFEPLAEKYTLLFYDQRGGGRSTLPKNPEQLHIDAHVSDLEQLRTHFGLQKLTLIGHSFGPMILAKYALAHPDKVNRMVFLGPVPPMQGDFGARYGANLSSRLTEEELKTMGEHFQGIVAGDDAKAACTAYWNIALKPRLAKGLAVDIVKGDCCAAPAEAIRYGMQTTNPATFGSLGNWDLRDDLKQLSTPTLILHGTQEAIPMDMVMAWEETLPNGALIQVPEAGHFTYAERPELVWSAITKFLAANPSL